MKRTLLPLLTATLLAIACGSNDKPLNTATIHSDESRLPGDTAVYGLACDGCTDSLLILMPANGDDPDTFNIFGAFLEHKVFGRPSIGDKMAVVRNGEDSTVASMVINIDRLQREWRYQVTPTLRHRPTDAATRQPVSLPDSFVRRWLQPKEYGYDIRRDYIVFPIGAVSEAEAKKSPVEYPALKRYREWHLMNGHLLLCETRRDSTGQSSVVSTDTADIILLRRDTLALRINGTIQGFYSTSRE